MPFKADYRPDAPASRIRRLAPPRAPRSGHVRRVLLALLAIALLAPLTIVASVTPAAAVTDCTVPITEPIRGTDVTLDQCYDLNFTHNGTDYAVHVYYRETPDAANTGEHELADVDNADGDNLNAVSMAREARDAIKFYIDQDFNWPPPGETDFNVLIGEDSRVGGINDEVTIHVDDDRIDQGDVLWHRLLAYHEFMHTVQLVNDGAVGWRGTYGEGISRAIEDRVDTTLDALTSGYWFIPEVQGVLSTDSDRTDDLLTVSYRSVLWWTWLMDQYRTGSEVDPLTGWDALEDFYAELSVAPDQATAIYDFISANASSFEADWIDYTLALYAYDKNPTDPRLRFLDPEVTGNGGALSGHNVITGGPAFATSSEAINARSVEYWEFAPANQCDFVAFDFASDGPDFGFSVMTADGSGNLVDRWSSQSDSYARTVATNSLSSVVGVVTGLKQGGSVDVGRGCVQPTIDITSPTSGAPAMVGTADNPEIFLTRIDVDGADGSPVGGLTANDFDVSLTPSGGGATIGANVVTSAYVLDDYWLAVQAPSDGDGAVTGQFYDLSVELGAASDTNAQSVLYVDQDEDVVVVLDRSGSMGGSTGKLEAAQNAADLLVTDLSDDDQGGYVSFNENAVPEVSLDTLDAGQRVALEAAITGASAGGETSIGDGMFEAQDMEQTLGDPSHVCSFVLLSDGHENAPAYWDDVKGDVRDNECPIHVIALGPGAQEPLLQEIGSQPAGSTYDYAQSAGTVPIGGDSGAGAGGGAGGGAGATPGGAIGWENNLSRIYDYKAIELQGRQRLLGAVGVGDSSCTGRSNIISFEDQPEATFKVGQSFISNGERIDVDVFDFGNGQTGGGDLRTRDLDVGIGDGQRAFPQNVVARLSEIEACRVSVEVTESGGLKNLEINGDLAVFESFTEADGAELGGAALTFDRRTGLLTATGEIFKFAIGTQESAMDNLRFQEPDEFHEFFVDKTSDVLQVSVAWQDDTGGAQTIKLLQPDGNPPAGAATRLSARGTSEVTEVKAPEPGLWRVAVDGVGQEYYVSASANTQLELHLFTGTPVDGPTGSQVPILGMLTSPDGPVVGAEVVAMVTPPNAGPQRLALFDDGNHDDGQAGDGVYGNWYTATNQGDVTVDNREVKDGFEPAFVGSYQVDAVATFDEHRREAQSSFALRAATDTDGDGAPDSWERENDLDPRNPQDFWGDDDFDDLVNGCEFWHGTDPNNSDTDGGGEADGSEIRSVEQPRAILPSSPIPDECGVKIRDPFDPADDPGGPVVSIVAFPELHDEEPVIGVQWSVPLVGEQVGVELWRRARGGGWALIARPTAVTVAYEDDAVVLGREYQYMVRTNARTSAGTILTNVVRTSGLVEAVEDPEAPVGDVLINGGAATTESTSVVLNLDAADDVPHAHEPAGVGGTPRELLEMRISDSPAFSGPWRPFAEEVRWDLGPLVRNEVGSVYVQFRDEAGNESGSSLGWTDSIVFVGPAPVPGADAAVEVAHVSSCLAGNGRVDTNIINTGAVAATYRIEFEGLSPRAFEVAAGDWWRMPITGRFDGTYDVVVKRDGLIVSDRAVAVSCDTTPPIVDGPEIQVVNACRGGNGYVLFQFLNDTATLRPWVIEFAGVPNRSTSAAAFGQSVRAVTGRPDGDHLVSIRSAGGVIATFDVTVDCDP